MGQALPNQYGVLLLNMGGPENLDGVEEYIYNLLSDPNMVRMPLGWLVQKPFARMISRKRAPKVRERYKLIGGSSPIGAATATQARLLGESLGLPVAFAMRYTPPSVNAALEQLTTTGAERLVVIPQYPQYSTVSTLSSLKDFKRQNKTNMQVRTIDRHGSQPDYIAAMQALLADTMKGIDPALNTHIMFVAHSIPESYITQGDPYAEEIEQTGALVIAGIDSAPPHSLAYQSRVGPMQWRGPTLEEELVCLVQNGVEQVVVQPLSFVSENLETLYDLDIVFKQQCLDKGIKAFHRVNTLGDSPLYIKALAKLAQNAISRWEVGDA